MTDERVQTGSKGCHQRESCRESYREPYITGWIDTGGETGSVPRVAASLTGADRWGGIKVRLNIGRMNYKVTPGLYGLGNPGRDSEVLVTANYKLTFDTVRRELAGQDVWILVLDTRGINVWCAAGKGTFGTAELVNRVELTGLAGLVNHRRLVVPQLGAVGVAAHQVKKQCGFSVVYGPVRATDIPAFLAAGLKATPETRCVRFSIAERFKVIPVEVVLSLPHLFVISLFFFLLAGLHAGGYTLDWGGGDTSGVEPAGGLCGRCHPGTVAVALAAGT